MSALTSCVALIPLPSWHWRKVWTEEKVHKMNDEDEITSGTQIYAYFTQTERQITSIFKQDAEAIIRAQWANRSNSRGNWPDGYFSIWLLLLCIFFLNLNGVQISIKTLQLINVNSIDLKMIFWATRPISVFVNSLTFANYFRGKEQNFIKYNNNRSTVNGFPWKRGNSQKNDIF